MPYTFKVLAYNAVGYSTDSPEITILAAAAPDKPESPSTNVYLN